MCRDVDHRPVCRLAGSHPAGGHSGGSTLPGLPPVSIRTLSGFRDVSESRDGQRQITLEQARQQASRALGPLNQLGQLSVEADPHDPVGHFIASL
jgi:hypothetical protein